MRSSISRSAAVPAAGGCSCGRDGQAPSIRRRGGHPALFDGLARLLGEALLQVADATGDVRHALLLIADLPLDTQRSAVADLFQRLYEGADIHLAFSQRHLLAPLARCRRSLRILDVDAADVFAQDF